MSKLLDVRGVAEILNVNWRTVLRLAESGDFPHGLNVGNHLRRWHPAEIDEYLARQAEKAKTKFAPR